MAQIAFTRGDEPAIRGETFRKAADDNIDLAEYSLESELTRSAWAGAAEIVGHINDESCAKFPADRHEAREIGRIRVHRKQTFGDQQNTILRIPCANGREFDARVVEIEVPEIMKKPSRGRRAFLEAIVRELVDDNMVGFPNQPPHRTVSGRPTRGAEHHVRRLEMVRESRLEFVGEINSPSQDGSAATVHAVMIDRVDGGGGNFGR